MRRTFISFLLAFAPLFCGLGKASAADAPPGDVAPEAQAHYDCTAEPSVRIRAAAAADAQAACEGALRARAFFAKAGLEVPPQALIEIVDRLPGDLDGKAVGCYVPATRRVLVLTYNGFSAVGTWFKLPVDRELYRSAVSHEVAHAMVACNAQSGRLPLAAHEYVAYVTMFATMDPRVRQQVLARFPPRGAFKGAQIQLLVYLVDPLQFAADSWRHYLRQPDRAAWLRDVVAGGVVEEWPSEGP